ncbi:type VI secretion system tip protein TssI/VgrG [Rubrivivax benzoatilyticus]|uniref:Type VI secretion system tip protein VgrG n=2 Tax=Rubrivivax benzoatilyticus TaxID=316997 RepID=A0ABX0I1V4_9BURK|nr:type VI secretion system tip protein TssI/VgrG [Rubrivivax benzoatilyticus]NHK99555.1 type VI secretion system tip protein VgrG [Rubrivivax benzoatilyticus]NHL25429.1 type VI secretion system tip protein VgrG [Rubrivivax benzoatilyticus]
MNTLSARGRLLTLHTALGPEALVPEHATIWEAVGPAPDPAGPAAPPRRAAALDPPPPDRPVGFRAELVVLSEDLGQDLSALPGSPALLVLQGPGGARRPFHGLVREAGWLGSDGGRARARLLVEPWLAWLGDGLDAAVFHEASIVEIVDQVLARAAPGLGASWRWDLGDRAALPRRGRCVQAHESDLGFVERLLAEEGLCHWFEHEEDSRTPGGGCHRLVIAGHAGAFAAPAPQPVRCVAGSVAPGEHTLTSWSDVRRLATGSLHWASRDDRSASLRPVHVASGTASGAASRLEAVDVAEAYAYPTGEHGRALAERRLQALAGWAARCRGRGHWREAAPGRCFTLSGHARHDGQDRARDSFAVLAVRHHVHNDVPTGGHAACAAPSGGPRYECELLAQPAALPHRPLPVDAAGRPELRLAYRQDAPGLDCAVVAGGPAAVTTDRDHRVQLRHPWERGAPADGARPGAWVRAATAVAGDDWGGVHPPRVGREVLLGFAGGRLDRPLVLGGLYTGPVRHTTAHGAATAAATPPWHPEAEAGAPPGPACGGLFAGWRTRELQTSRAAQGPGNQLVFDDSPGQERVELASDAASTRLQLGHLRHQEDQQPLQPRGDGLDLRTDAFGALRAGGGLLLSAHGAAGQPPERQLGTADAAAGLRRASDTLARLQTHAAAHGAGRATPDGPLPALLQRLEDAAQADALTGWQAPDLLLTAPAAVVCTTPGDQIDAVDEAADRVAGRLQALAGRRLDLLAAHELLLFAGGGGPGAGGGGLAALSLHAAAGDTRLHTAGAAELHARQDLRVASAEAALEVHAARALALAAAGAALQLGPDGIVLKAPGSVVLAASQVSLQTGGSGA